MLGPPINLSKKAPMVSPRDVTALLGDWSRGKRTALDQLLPLVYAELRRVAAHQLRNERADHTLLGGQPARLLPNASGLTWVTDQRILFSEIMAGTVFHMGIVTATEGR